MPACVRGKAWLAPPDFRLSFHAHMLAGTLPLPSTGDHRTCLPVWDTHACLPTVPGMRQEQAWRLRQTSFSLAFSVSPFCLISSVGVLINMGRGRQ